MARHRTTIWGLGNAGPAWSRRYLCEWGQVVGSRVRRIRTERGLRLIDVAQSIYRPDGGHFSLGYFSRLERGFASPPLWVYVVLAERFEMPPGRLLGTEDAVRVIDDAELTLVKAVRRLGLPPEEAILRLSGAAPR